MRLIALLLGYREFRDEENGQLIVFRETDHVHYYSWADAVRWRGR